MHIHMHRILLLTNANTVHFENSYTLPSRSLGRSNREATIDVIAVAGHVAARGTRRQETHQSGHLLRSAEPNY